MLSTGNSASPMKQREHLINDRVVSITITIAITSVSVGVSVSV